MACFCERFVSKLLSHCLSYFYYVCNVFYLQICESLKIAVVFSFVNTALFAHSAVAIELLVSFS